MMWTGFPADPLVKLLRPALRSASSDPSNGDKTGISPITMPSSATQFKAGDPNSKKGGRKPGSKNKATLAKEALEVLVAQREQRAAGTLDPEYTAALPGDRRWISPLEFMLKELNDERNSRSFRANMAVQAAPYCHRRMPSGVDKPLEGAVPITPFDLEHLEPHELRTLIALTGKIEDARSGTVDMEQ